MYIQRLLNNAKRLTRAPVSVKIIAAYIAIGVYGLAFTGLTGRSSCPFVNITGVRCPSCGMARALLSLLRLDILTALSYHPLVFIPPLVPLVYIQIGGHYIMKERTRNVIMILMIGALLAVWVARILLPYAQKVVEALYEQISI